MTDTEDISMVIPEANISPELQEQITKLIKKQMKKKGEVTYVLAHAVMEGQHFYTRAKWDDLWRFSPEQGIWSNKGEEYVRKQLTLRLATTWTRHKENSVVQWIHSHSFDDGIELGGYHCPHRIVMKNGTYDLKTSTFFEGQYFPDEYQVSRIPVIFDPKADCPAFRQLLCDIISNKFDRKCIEEWFGYHLYRSYKYAKFLLFLGGGANGKSTLLTVLTAFVGKENVSSCSLKQILQDKFKTAQLYHKLANISGDVSKIGMMHTGEIKQLTGGDVLTAEFKHKREFQFYNYGKLTFAANEVPRTYDTSDAFYRRFRPIDFLVQFLPDDPNTKDKDTFIAELTTEQELSGIFNLAVEGWKRLEAQKGAFTGEQSIADTRYNHALRSDPIGYFCKYLKPSQGMLIPKVEMFDLYSAFCHFLGKTPTSDNWFSKRLVKFIKFREPDDRWEGKRAWKGMTIDFEMMREEVEILAERFSIPQNSSILLLSFIEEINKNIAKIAEQIEGQKAFDDDLFETMVIGEEDTTE